jgi:hypothetical protein
MECEECLVSAHCPQKRAIQIIAPTISQIDHFAMQKKGLVLNV